MSGEPSWAAGVKGVPCRMENSKGHQKSSVYHMLRPVLVVQLSLYLYEHGFVLALLKNPV